MALMATRSQCDSYGTEEVILFSESYNMKRTYHLMYISTKPKWSNLLEHDLLRDHWKRADSTAGPVRLRTKRKCMIQTIKTVGKHTGTVICFAPKLPLSGGRSSPGVGSLDQQEGASKTLVKRHFVRMLLREPWAASPPPRSSIGKGIV